MSREKANLFSRRMYATIVRMLAHSMSLETHGNLRSTPRFKASTGGPHCIVFPARLAHSAAVPQTPHSWDNHDLDR